MSSRSSSSSDYSSSTGESKGMGAPLIVFLLTLFVMTAIGAYHLGSSHSEMLRVANDSDSDHESAKQSEHQAVAEGASAAKHESAMLENVDLTKRIESLKAELAKVQGEKKLAQDRVQEQNKALAAAQASRARYEDAYASRPRQTQTGFLRAGGGGGSDKAKVSKEDAEFFTCLKMDHNMKIGLSEKLTEALKSYNASGSVANFADRMEGLAKSKDPWSALVRLQKLQHLPDLIKEHVPALKGTSRPDQEKAWNELRSGFKKAGLSVDESQYPKLGDAKAVKKVEEEKKEAATKDALADLEAELAKA